MERLTNEQIEAIRKRAEADKDFDIFGDVPKLLAEIDRLNTRIDKAEGLLSDAHDLLDDVHCYDTEVYELISEFLYGGDSE